MVDLTRFANMLDQCEAAMGNRFTSWELSYVIDMRRLMNGRADQDDLGITMWSPTRAQYNILHEIWSKL